MLSTMLVPGRSAFVPEREAADGLEFVVDDGLELTTGGVLVSTTEVELVLVEEPVPLEELFVPDPDGVVLGVFVSVELDDLPALWVALAVSNGCP